MAMQKKLFAVLLLSLIFLASEEMAVPAEGRHRRDQCKSQSQHFKGPCTGDHDCATVCRSEAFSGGECWGYRGRCVCTKHC